MSLLPPIKNTSGEGFAVEDRIVALLAAHMVAGVSWQGAGNGAIRAIQCQMRQDGWLFDDVVLRLEHNGIERKCACSIKSHAVFGKRGAPREFATALWDQWLTDSSSGFQRDTDSITLISAQHEPDTREAWFGLTDAARSMPPEMLARRCRDGLESSPIRRAAFESLVRACKSGDPADISIDTAEMLERFRLVEHDFQHAESQSATHAILLCQQVLADDSRNRATELWEALSSHSAAVRRKGGSITLPSLLSVIASRFPLKQHPHFASDWSAILAQSRRRMEILPAKIGGSHHVERLELLQRVTHTADEEGVVVVLGDSGNGKSVLARQWAISGDAVWLRAGDLATNGGLRAFFGLSHGISELFSNVGQPIRLVLDGLDKCFDETAFDEAALVLRSALAADCQNRWKVVLTCCPEDWERVYRELIRREVVLTGEKVNVGRLTDEELRDVCGKVPTLRLLGQRPHLHPILRWPKALDLVASYWQAGTASLPWASESEFARWFWRSIICKDELAGIRGRVVRKLAVQLADRMAATATLDDFSPEESKALSGLAKEGHLEVDPNRCTVRFAHELVADWARQQELVTRGDSAGKFLRSRLLSPFWHRALRFHGLDLLETDATADSWQRLYRVFSGATSGDEMAQNLLLEAPIFAARQRAVLDCLWPALEVDDGKLLKRFLRQFLQVATIPDAAILANFPDRGAEYQLELAARYRLPWSPYWIGVLSFLAAHGERVTTLAREEVADVCLLWLPLHQVMDIGMDHAGSLAIVSARQVYRSGERWHAAHHRASAEEKACQALLAAAPQCPDEVTDLALKFCGRRFPDPEEGLPGEEHYAPSRFVPDLGPVVPWPDGPQRPCARIFRNAFMDCNRSAPFLEALPEVAAEVMFAVLLNRPRANRNPHDQRYDIDEHGFTRSGLLDDSCFWISGPFLTFLRSSPSVALPAIVRLVNFATDRGAEIGEEMRPYRSVSVVVEGETHEWRGHQFSYVWHQGHVFAPRSVGCALLSLEKWFYLLMDGGHSLDEHIAFILRESRSIALAGVLICVGKRKPELFLGPLRPLIEAIDFYMIEESNHRRGEDSFSVSAFYERSPGVIEAWREWVQMPHRKESIGQLALQKSFSNPEWREMIAECREKWARRLDAATDEKPAPQWLARIASQFDPANWHAEQDEDRVLIIYDPPEGLPQPTPQELDRLKRSELLTLLPFRCYQVLNGEVECPEEQMVEWWSQLEAVRALPQRDDEDSLRDAEDALSGIVAVAVVKHRAWLADDLAREKEAYSILTSIGASPPPMSPWFSEDDTMEFKWDNFAAWAVTTLWCESPDDPVLLQAVGALSLWDRSCVVSRVMSIAAEHRAILSERFNQLFAHAIGYAGARHRARMEKHESTKTFDRDAWVVSHLEKFLSGATDALPSSWQDLPGPAGDLGPTIDESGGHLDIAQLLAASEWASDLSLARNEEERLHWSGIQRQVLLCALARIEHVIAARTTPDPYDSQREYWPYSDEKQLLERIAVLVARMKLGEDHQMFWQPILALGRDGCHWIDAFGSHWLIEAAGHDEPKPVFLDQWLAMLTFAERSPAWEAKGVFISSGRDLWDRLLGLTPFSTDFWIEPLAFAVEAVWPFHQRWLRSHSNADHDVRTFIRFIRNPAARRLRIEGLVLLHEVIPLEERYFWNEEDIRDSFAGFLQLLQEEQWAELAADSTALDAFMAFGSKLASLQHPLGREVLNKAGNRLGKST